VDYDDPKVERELTTSCATFGLPLKEEQDLQELWSKGGSVQSQSDS
jgi:hypothetical protein